MFFPYQHTYLSYFYLFFKDKILLCNQAYLKLVLILLPQLLCLRYIFFILCAWLFFLCMSEPYAYSAWGGQKQVSDPLNLELSVAMSYHVDAGN